MLSGKIPIKPPEQDRQSSPENVTFHKFYSTEYEIELLLQTKFEFIKRQQSSSAAVRITGVSDPRGGGVNRVANRFLS